MKIFGIGTDIISIKRINSSIKKGGFNFKKKYFLIEKSVIVKKKKILLPFMLKDLLPKKLLQKHWGLELEKE